MREVFQMELQEVQTRLVDIAETVTNVIEDATKAFNESDARLAERAIALAESNENKALDLDELVIKILARQSPVARDLRILVSALRN